jgi:hypothetical protein
MRERCDAYASLTLYILKELFLYNINVNERRKYYYRTEVQFDYIIREIVFESSQANRLILI